MKPVRIDYTRATRVKPLNLTRDIAAFLDAAEARAWSILAAYKIKRKGNSVDEADLARFYKKGNLPGEVHDANAILPSIHFARVRLNALADSRDRDRALTLAYHVGHIAARFAGAKGKTARATQQKRRATQAKRMRESHYTARNAEIRCKAEELRNSRPPTPERKIITKLLEYAAKEGKAWPTTRTPYYEILYPSKI